MPTATTTRRHRNTVRRIGALEFLPVQGRSVRTCATDGCSRKGIWRFAILGYPVIATTPMHRGRQETICTRCADELAIAYLAALGITLDQEAQAA